MNTIHLEVQGMSCGGCVKSVTTALTRVPGVSTVNVDLPSGRATVTGDLPKGGDPLVLASSAAGYLAKLTSAATASSPPVKKADGCCG